jgi:hypothetical protein
VAVKRIASWNAKVGRNVGTVLDQLHDLIVDLDPQAIALQEFAGYVSAARDRYGDKWWILADADKGNDCPLFVRRAALDAAPEWGCRWYRTDWTGPQGGEHEGRTWTWCRLPDDTEILSLHRCWNKGQTRNGAAYEDEAELLVNAYGDPGTRPLVLIGDTNTGYNADGPHTMRDIANRVGGKPPRRARRRLRPDPRAVRDHVDRELLRVRPPRDHVHAQLGPVLPAPNRGNLVVPVSGCISGRPY